MLSAQSTTRFIKPALGVVLGTTVLVAGLVTTSYAQLNETPPSDQIALTAIPPRMGDDNSLLLQPGEKRQIDLRLINTSNQALSVNALKQDFIIEEDGSTPVPIEAADADNRWSLASWLTIAPGTQRIAPNQTVNFQVLIEVPEDALPGGHYAMITYQPDVAGVEESGESTNSQTTGVNQRVGTLLYVIVAGPINEAAFVRDFNIPQFMEYGPVPYSYTVENGSDVHIRPQMGIIIKNMWGKKVADMQPETKNIFPFTHRSFEGQWDRIWGFGRYTAELRMTYGTTNQLVIATAAFWLLPIKLIIAIIAILLLLILGGMSIRRHIIHKRQDQSQKIAELEGKLRALEGEKLKKFEE